MPLLQWYRQSYGRSINGKVDWTKAKLRWAKDHAETGISPKDWCEQNGLNYSSARRHITKKSAQTAQNPAQSKAQSVSPAQTAQPVKNQRVKKASAQTAQESRPKRRSQQRFGNQNASIHNLFSQHFGEAWEQAEMFTPDIRLRAVDAKHLQVMQVQQQYQADLDDLMKTINDENRPPTDDEFERLQSLAKRIDSCDHAIGILIDRANRLVDSADNRSTNAINRKRIEAETKRIQVDTKLKEFGIELAQANTEKAKSQTNLNVANLKALDKDEGGNKDDLDDILDEIIEERDGLLSEMPEVGDD